MSLQLFSQNRHAATQQQSHNNNNNNTNKPTMKVASTSSCSLLLSALFLLGAAVQHTLADDTCTVWVLNKAYQGLTVDSYNQNDGLCLDYYTSTSMDYDTRTYPPFFASDVLCACVCHWAHATNSLRTFFAQ